MPRQRFMLLTSDLADRLPKRSHFSQTDFPWEPHDKRFVILSSCDPNLGNTDGSGNNFKTNYSFYQIYGEKGDFRLLGMFLHLFRNGAQVI